jgi:chromate transporter
MSKVFEVFIRFFALGWVSFGGPAAHIGYFKKSFVDKLGWLNESEYSKYIALSQFLPGPGSSQVGFAVGRGYAGFWGGVAAFFGFTLPSFIILYLLAIFTQSSELRYLPHIIHALTLLAVVVVADATWGMFKSFCKDKLSVTIAIFTASVLILFSSLVAQLSVLLIASIVGYAFHKDDKELVEVKNRGIGYVSLTIFIVLLVATPLLLTLSPLSNVFAQFYSSGSLVFGGGHVVLPLLQETVGQSIDSDRFMAGYAAAQAIPGPMFTLATFLGAELLPSNMFLAAVVATIAIFLPGLLLVLAFADSWESFASRPKITAAIWGVNAAVVGLLFSALYPLFIKSVGSSLDMAVVLVGLLALKQFKVPIVSLVLSFVLLGVVLNFI